MGDMLSVDSRDFYQWLLVNFQRVNNERKAEITMLCWSIWKSRNELVWNQKNLQVEMVVISAKTYIVQWKKAQFV